MKETKAGETELKGKTGRHRTRGEREELVEAYRTSGQTQTGFAKVHGINVATLRTWIYQRRAADHAEPGRMEPVRIVGGSLAGGTRARPAITVRWPQGIELAVELDAAGVERLVRELLAPCLR